MNQWLAVARNTCLQTMRQPVYGLILVASLGGFALMPSLTGWTLDDDNKMLRDLGLSTLLMQGLFLACFAASQVLDTEIEDKTVLTVAAKPVGRFVFILGKYAGVMLAVLSAHYLGTVAFFMAMRHGVLQTASDTSDVTVLVMGPGLMLLVVVASTVLNYVWDWRFLPTMIGLSLPAAALGSAVLLVVDRHWRIGGYETTQTMDDLPPEIDDPTKLRGIIEFRPLEGFSTLPGHRGLLVRKNWKGPISDAEREYLAGLSPSLRWKKDINFLFSETRKLQAPEVFKSSILILVAVGMLAAMAVAASTRLGMISTLVVCLAALGAGLSAEQVLRPLADAGSTWASGVCQLLPNFQFFWMIDALSEDRVIPWRYVVGAGGYGLLYGAAALLLGAALFETREVG
jgi:hypothetical protein